MMLLHGVQHVVQGLRLDKETIGITSNAFFPLRKTCLLFFGLVLFFFLSDTNTLPNTTLILL